MLKSGVSDRDRLLRLMSSSERTGTFVTARGEVVVDHSFDFHAGNQGAKSPTSSLKLDNTG